MISNIDGNQPLLSATSASSVDKPTVVVPQDQSHIIDGKLRVIFFPKDLHGEPTALKIGGRVYQVDKHLVPFSREGGSLYFQTQVEPFKAEGPHDAEVKLTTNEGTKWVPITLNVLIALNR